MANVDVRSPFSYRAYNYWDNKYLNQRRSNIRTGSAADFLLIGFLVNFLCIVAPPVGTRSRRVRCVFFYRASYVGSTSRQDLATVTRYADCVKRPFRPFNYISASLGGQLH